MGRKKNKDDAMGGVPVCTGCSTALERLMAPSPYECDSCSSEIETGGLFFGCTPCDYSLCGACYVAEGVEEAEKEATEMYKVPAGTIHPEVWDLGEQYNIEEDKVKQLNEVLQTRLSTWRADMDRVHFEMRHARQVKSYTGLLCTKIKAMRNGTFVGMEPPNPQIAAVIKKYKLDQDAREKLTDFLQKQEKNGRDWEKDLWETEQRLVTATNPSMMALTMVVKLQQGKDLPPIKNTRKEDVVKRYDERHGHTDRARSRSREKRQRYASHSRDRGGRSGHDRGGRDDRGREGDRDRRYDRYEGRGRDDRGGRDDRARGGDRDRRDDHGVRGWRDQEPW